MGSTIYFLEGLAGVSIDPEEAKYIVTCDCPKNYRNYCVLIGIKDKLEKAIKRNSQLRLSVYELLYTFPTLTAKLIYERVNILEYFESMKEFGHNRTLIGELNKIMRANPRLKNTRAFTDLVDHVYNCLVQLGKYEGGKALIWSPDGLKREEINTKYIKDLEEGCYFTTHGRDKNNLRFAIRVVRDEEIIEGLKKLEELWRS